MDPVIPDLRTKSQLFPFPSRECSKPLEAAAAWLEIGAWMTAREEIDKLRPELRTDRSVVRLRCRIYRQGKRWSDLADVAEGATQLYPKEAEFWEHWAWAEYKLRGAARAIAILLAVAESFRPSGEIAYCLACLYGSQHRLLHAAMWLSWAFERTKEPEKLRARAVEQPELQKLWQLSKEQRPNQ